MGYEPRADEFESARVQPDELGNLVLEKGVSCLRSTMYTRQGVHRCGKG